MKSLPRITQSQCKYYQKLLQKKYRQVEQKFIIEGIHLIEEALDSDWTIEALLLSGEFQHKNAGESIGRRAKQRGVEMFQVDERGIQKLSDTVTAQGVVGIVKMKQKNGEQLWKALPQKSVVVALDGISDPGNVGTILRTCDWFGVHAVLLSEDSVDVFNPKVLRATMGAIFHLPIITDVALSSTITTAKQLGYMVIVTLTDSGALLDNLRFPEKSLIIFGSESHGVSQELKEHADQTVTIQRYGKAESLNVAVSCGIVLEKLRNVNNFSLTGC